MTAIQHTGRVWRVSRGADVDRNFDPIGKPYFNVEQGEDEQSEVVASHVYSEYDANLIAQAPIVHALLTRVLYELDHYVQWRDANGGYHLEPLMPEIRRAVNGGELDPSRCPHDDLELETYEEADERGRYTLFQCPGSRHTFLGISDGVGGWVPDFSGAEL